MKNMKTVDCVVVTYNRLDLLKECIHAIEKQTYPVNNFFIIDNCSTDNTWDYLKSIKRANIVPIRLRKNLGGHYEKTIWQPALPPASGHCGGYSLRSGVS